MRHAATVPSLLRALKKREESASVPHREKMRSRQRRGISQGDQKYSGFCLDRRHATSGAMDLKDRLLDGMRNGRATIKGSGSPKKLRET